MGIAERKQREKEARIEQIVQSAIVLFRKKGFNNTSMTEIADHAELSKGTLYIYFKSKEELFFKILEPVLMQFDKDLKQKAAKETESADKTLLRIVDRFYELHVEKPEATQMLTRFKAKEFKELLKPKEFEKITGLMNENLATLQKVIQRGIEQRIFDECDTMVTSVIIWNTVMGVVLYQENRVYGGKNDYIQSTLNAAIELLINGLRK